MDWYGFLMTNLSWTLASIYLIIFLYIIKAVDKPLYRRIYDDFKFSLPNFLFALILLSILFGQIYLVSPLLHYDTSFWVNLVVNLARTHLRSFVFYAVMVLYLWKKYDKLLPALYCGWFGIAMIEFTFIAQHYLLFNAFMGLNWYLPFVAVAIPFWFDRKSYSFNSKVYILFAIGWILEYVQMMFYGQGFTLFSSNGEVTANLPYILSPTVASWLYEIIPHIMKSLMTLAFCYVDFKKEKE